MITSLVSNKLRWLGIAQAMINEILGENAPANDLNGDGVVNVVDLQIVINAAIQLGCSATSSSVIITCRVSTLLPRVGSTSS